jgi:phosphatidylglycerophosphatase A
MRDRSTISDSRRSGAGDPPGALDVEVVPDRVWREPSFEFMRPRLSRWIALGFGSGLAPVAPGTVGTLWAWAAFLLLDPWLSPLAWWALIAAGFVAGCWACERTGRDLGVADHGGIVWDEVIAFWAVLVLVPSTTVAQVAAFIVFRFFDVLKPPPIRHVDRTVKNGFGVMFDDAIAAFYTVLVFAAWQAWVA